MPFVKIMRKVVAGDVCLIWLVDFTGKKDFLMIESGISGVYLF